MSFDLSVGPARLDARFAGRRLARPLAVALCVLLTAAVGTVRAESAQAPPAAAFLPSSPALTAPPAPAAPTAATRTRRLPLVSPLASGRIAPSTVAPAAPPAVPAAAFPLAVPTLPQATPPPAPAFAPAPPAPEPAPAAPVVAQRWLPTGKGMWLHEWERSEGGDAAAVVARALAGGLSHLYVQTGSSKKGWIGEQVLSELLPATEGTGLSVIAWDFPKLIDPEADARRLVQAATWQRPGLPRVAAVAPDVETSAEGTNLGEDRVSRYYATLRAELPPEIAVLATVPWPSEKRTGSYPYAETAVHSDAFVPMAYWYNRDPSVVTATSMDYLAQFGKPVMPVGQGYDGRLDAPHLAADPAPDRSVQAFVDAARAGGAPALSLWSWQTTGDLQWDVLSRAGAPPAS